MSSSRHLRIDDTLRDRASLYALDAMSDAELERYEAHLEECPVCAEEARGLQRAVPALAQLAPRVEPAPRLKQRLLDQIRAGSTESPPLAAQVWKGWAADEGIAGLFLRRAGDGLWEPTGLPGIDVRRLFVDQAADRVTMLVRMAPGSSYLPHRHRGAEECFVLQGDLSAGGVRLECGDYQRAASGSVHGVQSTEGGCVLLINSSLNDELLASANG
jgi:anti-sigma factor ChrR (cupin superfamily)